MHNISIAHKVGSFLIFVLLCVVLGLLVWKVSIPIYQWVVDALIDRIGFFAFMAGFFSAIAPLVLLEPALDWVWQRVNRQPDADDEESN